MGRTFTWQLALTLWDSTKKAIEIAQKSLEITRISSDSVNIAYSLIKRKGGKITYLLSKLLNF